MVASGCSCVFSNKVFSNRPANQKYIESYKLNTTIMHTKMTDNDKKRDYGTSVFL